MIIHMCRQTAAANQNEMHINAIHIHDSGIEAIMSYFQSHLHLH